MIRSAIDEELQSFIDFLNRRYPTERDAVVAVLPGYYRIILRNRETDEDIGAGWACYDANEGVLWIPGEIPDDIEELTEEDKRRWRFESVAHEFVHHLQFCEGRPFDEDEAEQRAREIVEEYRYGYVRRS